MKRLALSLLASLALTACGMYTNVPAQVTVTKVTPGHVAVQVATSEGTRLVQSELPTITLRAEPGSIGVTYDKMTITYTKVDGKTPVESSEISPVTTFMTFHLDSSATPSGTTGLIKLDDVGKTVYAQEASVQLPVINRHVEDYGLKSTTSSNYANSTLTAEVTWYGTDDAGFPSDLRIHVPITFSGVALGSSPASPTPSPTPKP